MCGATTALKRHRDAPCLAGTSRRSNSTAAKSPGAAALSGRSAAAARRDASAVNRSARCSADPGAQRATRSRSGPGAHSAGTAMASGFPGMAFTSACRPSSASSPEAAFSSTSCRS